MNDNEKIRQAIKGIIDSQYKSKNIVLYGEVVDFDTISQTMTILDVKGTGDLIAGIKVSNADPSTNFTVPKIGSQVVILRNTDDNSYYLSRVEDVESMTVKVESLIDIEGRDMKIGAETLSIGSIEIPTDSIFEMVNLQINATGNVTFNSGTNGGLVQAAELTVKLASYEAAFNSLAGFLDMWATNPATPTLADITSLRFALKSWITVNTPFPISTPNEISNDKVKH